MLNTRLIPGSTIRELMRVSISSKDKHVVVTMDSRAWDRMDLMDTKVR
jgi:hypothetical protein